MLKESDNKGRLIILTGASGVGKDETMKKMMELDSSLTRVVTYCADRGPRGGEVEGKDYYFISEEKFKEMVKNGEFFEYNNTPGVIKGTGRGDVEKVREGKKVIWRIDPEKASRVKNELVENGFEDLVSVTKVVYLGTPTIPELWRRINIRESNETKEKKLIRLKSDWKIWNENKNNYDIMIMNETDKLDKTVDRVLEFVSRR